MLNWFEIFESWNTVWKLYPKVYESWKIFKWLTMLLIMKCWTSEVFSGNLIGFAVNQRYFKPIWCIIPCCTKSRWKSLGNFSHWHIIWDRMIVKEL